jgi:hypothetical protein
VLVVNLHADDVDHPQLLRRIGRAFEGNAMQVLAPDKCNCIVFAARGRPVTLERLRATAWAGVLEDDAQRLLRGEFANIGWNACALPPDGATADE